MSKTSFTPGPWCPHYLFLALRGARKHLELDDVVDPGFNEITESKADCNLACAAPEMYEAGDEALAALYGAREVLGDVANISHAINMLESARSKARGEK